MSNPAAGVLVLLVALWALLAFLGGRLDAVFGWAPSGIVPTPGFGGGSSGGGGGGAGGGWGPEPAPAPSTAPRPASSGYPLGIPT